MGRDGSDLGAHVTLFGSLRFQAARRSSRDVLRFRAVEVDAQADDLPAPSELDVRIGLKSHHAIAILLVKEYVQRAALHGRRRVDSAAHAERRVAVVRGLRGSQQRPSPGGGRRRVASRTDPSARQPHPADAAQSCSGRPCRRHGLRIRRLAKTEAQVQPVGFGVGLVDEQRKLARTELGEAPVGHLAEQARAVALAAPARRRRRRARNGSDRRAGNTARRRRANRPPRRARSCRCCRPWNPRESSPP